jgi:transcriptional regulator with XRE-family HTH domain
MAQARCFGRTGQPMATLRALREQRYLTQEQFAVAAEVSASTVYNAEAGKISPRLAIVRRLARVLGVEPGEVELVRSNKHEENRS